jgi:hypothetical protein
VAKRDNIVSLNRSGQTNGQTKSVEQNKTIIDGCRLAVSRGIGILNEIYFERLDDALYKLADKAETNDLQNSYFDTMREMRKERENIEKTFLNNVLACYDAFCHGARSIEHTSKQEIDYDNLALIESDILEEELAISNMVARGENICARELYAIEQRVSRIRNGIPVESKNNPLSPDKICNAFRSSICAINVDIATKLVIYKVFEQEVVAHLDEVYAGINELMRDAGILPKLKPKIRPSKITATTSGRHKRGGTGKASAEQISGLTEESEEVTLELFDTLRQLLSSVTQGATETPVFNTSLPRADTQQLIEALSALQYSDAISKSFDSNSENQGYPHLKSDLLQQIRIVTENETIGSVKQIDHDTIDMISMLFEFILGDPKIPDAMKVLLSQLQIPIIKVAIIDKGFFSNRAHPARRLLNGLAHAVVGWSDDRSRSKNSLYGKVESVVRRVLSDFNEDIQLFADLADELDGFLNKERRGSEASEKRISQIASGKEQLGVAKRRANMEIELRLKAVKELPLAVANLLHEGWRDVLILHFLRHGAKSKEWQNALDAMDCLIGTIEPKADPKEHERMLREIPELLETMRKEMADIQCDQYLMGRLFGDLEKVHVECMQGNKLPANLIASKDALEDIVKTGTRDGSKSAMPDTDQRESPKYIKLAESIPLGSWLELKEKGGVKSRIKLLWRSSVSDNCLFVNRKAVKVKEMTVAQLALALRVGKAIVITGADDALIDRAFAAMMQSLRGSGHPEPAPA